MWASCMPGICENLADSASEELPYEDSPFVPDLTFPIFIAPADRLLSSAKPGFRAPNLF